MNPNIQKLGLTENVKTQTHVTPKQNQNVKNDYDTSIFSSLVSEDKNDDVMTFNEDSNYLITNNKDGSTTTFMYDDDGNLLKARTSGVKDKDGNKQQTITNYDADGNKTTAETTYFVGDTNRIAYIGKEDFKKHTKEYTEVNPKTNILDNPPLKAPNGENAININAKDGSKITLLYDKNGDLMYARTSGLKDKNGNKMQTITNYNDNGKKLTEETTVFSGNSGKIDHTETTTYIYKNNRLDYTRTTGISDKNGNKQQLITNYDAAGKKAVESTTTFVGNTGRIAYIDTLDLKDGSKKHVNVNPVKNK